MSFQVHISQLEQGHAQRLLEVAARHHQELDLQTQRLRESQLQSQSILESREKAHRQRVRGLERQVQYLLGGLPQQIKKNTPSSCLLLCSMGRQLQTLREQLEQEPRRWLSP